MRALAVLVEHPLDAGQRCAAASRDLADRVRVAHVDVRDLMIGHGEGVGGAGVELLAPLLLAHAEPTRPRAARD